MVALGSRDFENYQINKYLEMLRPLKLTNICISEDELSDVLSALTYVWDIYSNFAYVIDICSNFWVVLKISSSFLKVTNIYSNFQNT